eukprot:PITA_24538
MLSWNSRGLGHPSKLVALKELINSENPEIMLIQETKQDQSEMSRVISHQQSWIQTTLESRTGGQSVTVYNVYAPNQYREKEICWDTLTASIEMDRNTNLIVAGDFNLVLHANEKRGGNFTSDPFRSRLEAIIQDHALVDIRPKNRRYT